MIVFGAPRPDADHQGHAVACALLMQRLVGQLNRRRRQRGQPTVELRIGINSGDMMAGLVGSRQRLEYTVVGDAVNLASRLRSEEHTSELQSRGHLVCRLLLENNNDTVMISP